MALKSTLWILLGHLLLLLAGSSVRASTPAQVAPNDLNGEAQSTAAITWTWTDSTGESFYELHEDGSDSLIAWLPYDSTSYPESGLSENTQYRRHLHASFSGFLSPPSISRAIYTLVHTPGGGDFSLALGGPLRIDVTVVPPPNSAADQTGVEISRSGAGVVGFFAAVYTLSDAGLQPETEYSYFIRFRNGDGRATAYSYPERLKTPPEETHPPSCRVKLEIPESPTYLPEGDPYGDEMMPGNKITAYVSWETDTPGHGPTERILTVVIYPSQVPGQCTNSGEKNFDDFAIEESDNQDRWKLGADLIYDQTQSLSAVTRYKVKAFTPVPIVLTSYDWGGTVTVHAEAEECGSQEKEAVEDFDKDRLPDQFERESFFWLQTAQGWVRTPFNFASPLSAGQEGVRDADNDLDMDARPAPVHGTTGDGLSAFEEYRGVKVKGKVARTKDSFDERTQSLKGGTDVKDLYVLDESAQAGKEKLFFVNSLYLADSGLIWHVLEKEDVYKNGAFQRINPKPTGDGDQYAVRMLQGENLLDGKGQKAIALADTSVNSGVPVRVDLKKIISSATALRISKEDLMDWIVSHEIHHKLGLGHNQSERSYVAAQPKEADRKSWWKPRDKTVHVFIAALKEKGRTHPLEYIDAIQLPGADDLTITAQNFAHVLPQDAVTIHGDDHSAGIQEAVLPANPQQTQLLNIKVQVASHERNLMDPVIHPRETGDVKKDPLTTEQEKKPNVRS